MSPESLSVFLDKHCICVHKRKIRHTSFEIYRITGKLSFRVTLYARLLFVTPYLSESYTRNMEWCQGRFDGVIYPPLENVPPRYAISRRNRWIVEQADLLFTYITHEFGGAYAMYRYAKQKDKEIYQLGNRIQKQKEGS